MIVDQSSVNRLFLVDGSSLLHRSFHALPDLRSASGVPTGAVYGFVNTVQGLLDEYHPTHMIVAFDRPEPTFRHETYAGYKGNRASPPDELIVQMPLVRDALEGLGIAWCEQAGFEADDLIGTLSVRAAAEGFQVVIVTGDKDLLQLVGPRIQVLQHHFKSAKLYGEKEVFDR